jgi:hypothetical protein
MMKRDFKCLFIGTWGLFLWCDCRVINFIHSDDVIANMWYNWIKVDSDILSTIAENIHWGRDYG